MKSLSDVLHRTCCRLVVRCAAHEVSSGPVNPESIAGERTLLKRPSDVANAMKIDAFAKSIRIQSMDRIT